MIKITEANILSTVASIRSSDSETYLKDAWSRIDEENPIMVEYSVEQAEELPGESDRDAFLLGMCLCYEIIRRQMEANEMSA
jgi:hypothetical protein